MSTRKIISIKEGKCTAFGKCIPNCPEGALQIIDGKVRLVSDLHCDALGAVGHCPEDAIKIIEREAEPYDEAQVLVLGPHGLYDKSSPRKAARKLAHPAPPLFPWRCSAGWKGHAP